MADQLECVVAWCDGEPFAIVDEQIEDEDGTDLNIGAGGCDMAVAAKETSHA